MVGSTTKCPVYREFRLKGEQFSQGSGFRRLKLVRCIVCSGITVFGTARHIRRSKNSGELVLVVFSNDRPCAMNERTSRAEYSASLGVNDSLDRRSKDGRRSAKIASASASQAFLLRALNSPPTTPKPASSAFTRSNSDGTLNLHVIGYFIPRSGRSGCSRYASLR